MSEPLQPSTEDALRARIRELEAALIKSTHQVAKAAERLQTVTSERDSLRRSYELLREQHELLKRRLFIAKAERIDVRQLEIEFAEQKRRLDAMAAELGLPSADNDEPGPKRRGSSKGRRDLRTLDLPEERVELLDYELEKSAVRIGFEESCRLGHRRGGAVRIVVARATYKLSADASATESESISDALYTVPVPKELLRRSLCAPSMLAYVLHTKYGMGLPFYRLEALLAVRGAPLDRGSMSRLAEDAGASLGAIVEAMADDARRNAFCLSTDATGVAIQPAPIPDKSRQACRKGHFFVVLADRDHVFFEFRARHDGAAVCEMFRGYSGYIQADAHAIYDTLFRGDAVAPGAEPPREVACWAHVRRKFWEAACAKHTLGREGLFRIRRLFELDASWSDKPPDARRTLRQTKLRSFLDDFFVWAEREFDAHKLQRGVVATALGYAVRQRDALRRVLEDGRLKMDNNASERALRPIAAGRKSWLFFGSDDHASAAANLFSLLASCRLHGLEPEAYLRDVIRVVPYWPSDRYLELAPKNWTATCGRLDADQLAPRGRAAERARAECGERDCCGLTSYPPHASCTGLGNASTTGLMQRIRRQCLRNSSTSTTTT